MLNFRSEAKDTVVRGRAENDRSVVIYPLRPSKRFPVANEVATGGYRRFESELSTDPASSVRTE